MSPYLQPLAWLQDSFVPAPGVNDWGAGLRLTAAFLAPLAVGLALGHATTGLLAGMGAFLVANADLGNVFSKRLRLLVPTFLAVPTLTVLGIIVGRQDTVAVPVAVVILLLAGLGAAFGAGATKLGTFASLAYVVGIGLAAQPGTSPAQVFGTLLAGGGYAIGLSGVDALLQRHRDHEPAEPWHLSWSRARAHLDTGLVRHAVALAVAGAVALLVVPFTHQSNGVWLVASVLFVIKPGLDETRSAALVRAVGTLAGAAVAGGFAALTQNPWVLLGAAFALAWLAQALISRSLGLFVVLMAPLSVLLVNVLSPGNWSVALLRTGDVAAGSLIAVGVGVLLLPRKTASSAVAEDPSPSAPLP